MNQEKIGKFIAICRKEQKLTQEQLAEKLGVTDKSVSRWENGKCLPDVSLFKDLCNILGITLNEFFSGEKIKDENFKEQVDNNLFNALENSSFTLKEKIKYYKRKWKKEHISKFILCFISWLVLIIALKFQNVEFYVISTIAGMLATIFYIVLYNQMMIYVENNAYKKIGYSNDSREVLPHHGMATRVWQGRLAGRLLILWVLRFEFIIMLVFVYR